MMELLTAVVTRTIFGPYDNTWFFCALITGWLAVAILGTAYSALDTMRGK